MSAATEEPCACGYAEPTNSVYRPGHDGTHRDRLVNALVGPSDGTHASIRERADRINALLRGLAG